MLSALNIFPVDPGSGIVNIVVVLYLNVADNTNPELDAHIPATRA